MIHNYDFCIAGGGMVGLSIANQLIEKTIFWESGSGATEIWVGTGNSSLNQLALYQNVAFE